MFCGEVVFCFADLFGVEVPVPRLELKAALLRIDEGLDIFGFSFGFGGSLGTKGVKEVKGGFGGLGHLVFELPGGEGW